jgi:apolipoprotein N-acyltransferase
MRRASGNTARRYDAPVSTAKASDKSKRAVDGPRRRGRADKANRDPEHDTADARTAPPGRNMLAVGLALSFAVSFVLAFPPFALWPLAFVAPLPLALLARLRGGWKLPAFLIWLAGTGVFLFEHRWQAAVSAVGYPIGCAIAGLYLVALLLVLRLLYRHLPRAPFVLLLPLVWTAIEVVRGEYLFGGYAFFLLAHPTIGWPAFPQGADLLGTYYISFLTALPAGALIDAFDRSHTCRFCRYAPAVLAVLLVVLAAAYGRTRLRETPTPEAAARIRLAAVQTNVPQSNKLNWTFEQALADYERAVELTAEAATPAHGPTPDVIVWPETMLPAGFGLNAAAVAEMRRHQLTGAVFADDIVRVQRELGVPLLLGAIATDGLTIEPDPGNPRELIPRFDRSYNSAFIIEDGAVSEVRYDKLYLTPFGEVIPYLSRIDWLERLALAIGAGGMSFDLSPGTQDAVLEATARDGRSIRLAAPICFEATSARVCRDLVYEGSVKQADVLVNLTNDGWFGSAVGGREQHLQAARFRTIELRAPMLRSANTGISAAIDSAGRLLAVGPESRQRDWEVDGVLTADLPLDPRRSAYARVGGLFEPLVVCLTAGLTVWAGFRARKEQTRCATGDIATDSSSA